MMDDKMQKKRSSLWRDFLNDKESMSSWDEYLIEKILTLESFLSAQNQPQAITADVEALCDLILKNKGALSLILQNDRERIIKLAGKLAGGDTGKQLSTSAMESMFGTHQPGVTGVFVVEDDANQNAHFRAVDGDTIE